MKRYISLEGFLIDQNQDFDHFRYLKINQTIHKQNITFTKDKKAQSISVLLNADKVGIAKYKAVISSEIR